MQIGDDRADSKTWTSMQSFIFFIGTVNREPGNIRSVGTVPAAEAFDFDSNIIKRCLLGRLPLAPGLRARIGKWSPFDWPRFQFSSNTAWSNFNIRL